MFPWQKQDTSPKFTLLLTCLEDGINIDRAALRQAGLTRLHSIDSGAKALEIIASQNAEHPILPVDFVVCTGELADMSFEAFMRAVAGLGVSVPLMCISGNSDDLATGLSHGAAVALSRPYSLDALARAVDKLRERQLLPDVGGQAALQADGDAGLNDAPADNASGIEPISGLPASKVQANSEACFRPLAPRPEQVVHKPSKSSAKLGAGHESASKPSGVNNLLLTRNGLSFLREGRLAQAEEYLSRALAYDALDLEAALGLSRLYQQAGDMERSHRFLHKAGVICLATRQTERADVIFSRLPEKWQGDHELIEAQELLQEGDFDSACEMFVGICTSRSGVNLQKLLARSCQFTSAPEEAIREICVALRRAGYTSTARSLASRMLQVDEREWQAGGFLSAFPRLQEVWAVARFTARAFKAAS